MPVARRMTETQVAGETGSLLARYPGRRLDRLAWLTKAIPGLLLCCSLLGYGAWRWYYGYTRFGVVAASAWSRTYLLLGALAAALLAIWLILRRAEAHRAVAVYEHGVGITTSRHKERFWRWKEIIGLASGSVESRFFGLPITRQNWLKIYPREGKPISLDDSIRDLASLSPKLKSVYYSNRMSALRSAFYADRWVPFGPLAVHRQALRVKNKLYPWKLVQDIQVRAGSLVIKMDSLQPIRISTRKIPNLELMISIIQEGVIL